MTGSFTLVVFSSWLTPIDLECFGSGSNCNNFVVFIFGFVKEVSDIAPEIVLDTIGILCVVGICVENILINDTAP